MLQKERAFWSGHIDSMYTLKELVEILKKIGFQIVFSRKTFGLYGTFISELKALSLFFLPVVAILQGFLAKMDVRTSNSKGNGILVLARKI